MGVQPSKEDYIRSHPVRGNADAFYFACKEGNLDYVKKMLPSLTVEQINQLQPNGSTYLHAASYNGRTEIVRLLLEHGAIKSKLNLHGLTAYDEAISDDVIKLFHRPRDDHGENRFVDKSINETFHLTPMVSINKQQLSTQSTDNNNNIDPGPDDSEADDDFIGNDWIEAFNNFDKYSALILSTTIKSKLFYQLMGIKKDSLDQLMKYVLDSSFKQTDSDFNKIDTYLKEYMEKKSVTLVIYLYTLQTSFYPALQDTNKCAAFTMLLYRNLSQLTKRFFKGRIYRGMKMTKKELNAYGSMLEHKGYALMNTKFQSSSMNQSIAVQYLFPPDTSENENIRKYDVLVTYDFHDICQTAINLTKVNGKYLSEYQCEAEVLILPYTLFEICDMHYDPEEKRFMIYLKNIVPPGILSSFKYAMKEFMNMSPNELQHSMRRLERNLHGLLELNQENSS